MNASVLIVSATLLELQRQTSESLNPPGNNQPYTFQTVDSINWSSFAYMQYATNAAYLCNSVMLFERLHRLTSKADRLMMYPNTFSANEKDTSYESRLLRKARDEYGVELMPVKVQTQTTWAESYTKLLAFNQTQYKRVLSLDSDATVLQPMDELSLLPPCPVAMPRAYWLNNSNSRTLGSHVLLIQPSEFEFARITAAIANAGSSDYDMEIVNKLYKDSALILPHRPYGLLTGEFRFTSHTAYLDWPVPKPWVPASPSTVQEEKPACEMDPATGREDDCRARDLWLGFYADFAIRRESVCGMAVASGLETG
ncbi:nucleotide-diphospho-sugar transferase [Aspergillus heterothallicus]